MTKIKLMRCTICSRITDQSCNHITDEFGEVASMDGLGEYVPVPWVVDELEDAATDCDGHTPYSILMALAGEIRELPVSGGGAE